MKKLTKILAILLALSMCFTLLVACNTDPCKDGHDYGEDGKCKNCGKTQCEASGHSWVNAVCKVCGEEYELVDYAGQLKLNRNSGTAQYTSSNMLKQYVDGDTTHFYVPESEGITDGVLKARYLAVNTPESTGKIEPYGKLASNFTHDKLQSALDNGGAILVESDTNDGKWNHDSYGRYMVWVWYKSDANADWRNLNVELLQNGYAFGSNPSETRYGDICTQALAQSVTAKLVVQSGLADPDFYYGDAIELSLRELRCNLEAYEGVKVAFEGVVTMLSGGGSYLEDKDEETGIVYGMYVYYGTEKTSQILEWLGTPGNRVRVVGKLSNYNGSWQVSDVQYRAMRPNDPSNIQLVDTGKSAYYQPIEVADFFGDVDVPVWDDEKEDFVDKTFQLCDLILNTTVSMSNLKVVDMYTTGNGGNNDGAISITCEDEHGNEIVIRTGVFYKADGTTLVTEDDFEGRTISVKGIVDYYADGNRGQGQYQVKVLNFTDITFVD